MNKCEEYQKELHVYLCDDVDAKTKTEIENHLAECPDCAKALQRCMRISEILHSWQEIEPSPSMYETIKSAQKIPGIKWRAVTAYMISRKTAMRLVQMAAIVVITLLINSWLQKPFSISGKEQATINFFLQEHQSAVVQSLSNELLSRPATHMYIGRNDILYFEYVENHPKGVRPGMIVRGPKVRREIALKSPPEITKGHPISRPEIPHILAFKTVVPEHLPDDYMLTSIRVIEDYNSLHLIYTRELDTISLFQQPSHSPGGLSVQDFRDYAIYCSQEPETDVKIKGKGTILAWSIDQIAFVLIGDEDLSELMAIVPSINKAYQR
jgi:hypothetical protein